MTFGQPVPAAPGAEWIPYAEHAKVLAEAVDLAEQRACEKARQGLAESKAREDALRNEYAKELAEVRSENDALRAAMVLKTSDFPALKAQVDRLKGELSGMHECETLLNERCADRNAIAAECYRLKGELAEATKQAIALEGIVDTERQERKETANTLFFVRKDLQKTNGKLAEARRLIDQCSRGTNAYPYCLGCGRLRGTEHGSWCPLFNLAAPSPAESTGHASTACHCGHPFTGKCKREPTESTDYAHDREMARRQEEVHGIRPAAPSDDIRERLETLHADIAQRFVTAHERISDHDRRLKELENRFDKAEAVVKHVDLEHAEMCPQHLGLVQPVPPDGIRDKVAKLETQVADEARDTSRSWLDHEERIKALERIISTPANGEQPLLGDDAPVASHDVLERWDGALAKMAEGPAAPQGQAGHEFVAGCLAPQLCGHPTGKLTTCARFADDPIHTGAKP